MYEDNYINKYDIFNEGTTLAPDWRFATEAEMTALADLEAAVDAAEVVLAPLQIALDDAQAAVDAQQIVIDDAQALLDAENLVLAGLTPGSPEHDAQLLVVAAASAALGVAVADMIPLQTALDDVQAAFDLEEPNVIAAEAALAPVAEVTLDEALIRIKMDAVDADGYILEPIASLKWYKVGAVTDDMDPSNDSDIILDDPNNVFLPAGWTVFYFGYLDRSGANQKTLDYTGMIVDGMLDPATAPALITYDDQPAWFTGIVGLDDDPATPGVNVVVDYNGDYMMPTEVEAQWLDMFDDLGAIINAETNLDFSVEIADDMGVLETINYTWNATTELFDLSAEQTVIDTSVFGKGYTATFSVTTPEGDVTTTVVDIVIGVMPPRFHDVVDRYAPEGVYIDLLEGIWADDGYGTDVTDTVEITVPEGFNMYNPLPGMYEIELEFTHHVHFDGIPAYLEVDGDVYPWDGELNLTDAINAYGGQLMIWTDTDIFRTVGSGWGSVMFIVGADGLVDEIYDRYTWEHTTSTGTVVTDGVIFAAWQAAVVIEDGGYAIAAHGSTYGTNFRDENMSYDAPVTVIIPEPDFDYDIVTEASYMLTIDDKSAPFALVVDEDYKIEAGEFDDIDEAILANVVAFDLADMPEDLAIYVSNNGGLDLNVEGTYVVEVTVEDLAGNTAEVEFDLEVIPASISVEDVQAMLDDQTITAAEIQALLDDQTITEAEIQAMLDAQIITEAEIQVIVNAAVDAAVEDMLSEADVSALITAAQTGNLTEADVQALIDTTLEESTGCGSSLAIGTSLVGIFAVFGGAGLFFIRKRK